MISNKPCNIHVYNYIKVYDKFGKGIDADLIGGTNGEQEDINTRFQRRRKATDSKNTDTQVVTIVRSYIVTQQHNKLQEALKNKLITRW